MMVTTTSNELDSFLLVADEPAWLTEFRRRAHSVYLERRNLPLNPEEWKRVDLRSFRPDQYHVTPGSCSGEELTTLLRERAVFGGQIVHHDGHRVSLQFDESLKKRGVWFGDLFDFAREKEEIARACLMQRAVQVETDRFSAWHAAMMTGGTVLYVPKGVEIQAPFHSLIGIGSSNAADFSHTLVILEEGARATLLEETASTEGGLHVGCVELLLGAGSNLRYAQLQNWGEKTWHFSHQACRIAKDAAVQWTVAGLGAKLAHINQHIHLDGPGASAEVNGVTFATGRQVLSYYTQQTHHAPNTRSDLLYKDVLRDRARVIWRGLIRVDRDAQKTDGYQRNDSLILSPESRADSIPGLEIEADDVRCTHGATCGRVDRDQVFYAMCRGLSEYEAMHMIVEGFFHRVYDRIAPDTDRRFSDKETESATGEVAGLVAVRETLSQAVERKLGIGF